MGADLPRRHRLAIVVGMLVLFIVAGPQANTAPPSQTIRLNSVTPVPLPGNTPPTDCVFDFNFTVSGLKGNPGLEWGVFVFTPEGGDTFLAGARKADNDRAITARSPFSETYDTGSRRWVIFLINPRTGAEAARSAPVTTGTIC